MSEEWRSLEAAACAKRTANCNDTLTKLLGPSRPGARMPRVALCFSGGGWRAMTSACALLDALSTPLAPTETNSGQSGIKLLDTVTHIAGLSGGSWALFTTLVGAQQNGINPFHQPPGKAEALPHPWMHGTGHAFDENIHAYDGLVHMLSSDVVERACHRAAALRKVGFLVMRAGADTSIAGAMTSEKLGATLVERWSNFIANDILNFVDRASGDADAVTGAPKTDFSSPLADRAATEPFGNTEPASMTAVGGSAPATEAERRRDAEREQIRKFLAITNQNASRNVNLGDLRSFIEDGSFPFVICSAIANKPKTGNDPRPAPNVRAYDWVEMTPWFVRNPPRNFYTPSVNGLSGYFAARDQSSVATKLHVHNLMAICGSAFACDVACVLPPTVSEVVHKYVNVSSEPILGGGTTDVVIDEPGSGTTSNFGVLRDAGIDFNVPLPALLADAGRSFDIIVVHDAGANSTNAFELQRAVDLGYLQLMPSTDPSSHPLTAFGSKESVRVYRGLGGYPTILYFLGLTERGTHQIVHTPLGLRRDVQRVRENVLQQLLPLLVSELRIAKAVLDGASAAPTAPQGPVIPLSVIRSSTSRRAVRLDVDEEAEGEQLQREHSESQLGAASQDTNSFGGSQSQPSLIASRTSSTAFNPLAEALVVNAMTQGRVHDAYDAYLLVEESLFAAVPVARRMSAVGVLEEFAAKRVKTQRYLVAPTPSPASLGNDDGAEMENAISTVIGAQDVVELLVEFGLLVRASRSAAKLPSTLQDGTKHALAMIRGDAHLATGWGDYFAASAMLSLLKPNSVELNRVASPMSCPRETLDSLQLAFSHKDSKVWSLLLIGAAKIGLLPEMLDRLKAAYVGQLSDALRTPDASPLAIESLSQALALAAVTALEAVGLHVSVVLRCFASLCAELAVVLPPSATSTINGHCAVLHLATAAAESSTSDTLLRIVLSTYAPTASIFPRTPLREGPAVEESLGTLADAACRNVSDSLRAQMLQYLESELQFSLTYDRCVRFALSSGIKLFVSQHLDDKVAVTTILQSPCYHARANDHRHREAAVQEIWRNGVASNLFRDWMVEECVNNYQFYWLFLAPRVKEVRVPPNASPETAAKAVEFAEKCRRLQLINVPGHLAHNVRAKLGEVQGKMLEKKDEIKENIEQAKKAAMGKIGGLLGRFGR